MLSESPLDLGNPQQRKLIERIYWSRFSGRVRAMGLDPEDALQDLYLILCRYQITDSKSMWDPARGSLSTYVFRFFQTKISHMAEAIRARPVLCLDDTDHDDADDARTSAYDRAEAPAEVSELDLQDLREAIDLATDVEIPASVLARIASGMEAGAAARAEGCDLFTAAEVAEAWGRFAAPYLPKMKALDPEPNSGWSVLDFFA